MRFGYDWQQTYMTVSVMAADLQIKFSGPGFYLSKTDTILIVPEPPNESASRENVWDTVQPDNTQWRVFVWNCLFSETIFSAINLPPTRQDDR